MLDYFSWIAQVEYQGQKQYTRLLEHKPLIDTSCRIGYRVELKYFHFAQFFLIFIKQLINLDKVRTEDLKFRTDPLD